MLERFSFPKFNDNIVLSYILRVHVRKRILFYYDLCRGQRNHVLCPFDMLQRDTRTKHGLAFENLSPLLFHFIVRDKIKRRANAQ